MPHQSQPKQRLSKSKRHVLPIRLEPSDHIELIEIAIKEQRSMSFIAMRRYKAGLELELKQKQ